jgi:murein DD-endopeptidase MepM/ murein hydrolase activator NlpD
MANPIPPFRITTPFGKRGGWAAGYHTGDDYSTNRRNGIKVLAAKGGWVVSVGNAWGSSYGKHIVLINKKTGIRHGYCHLSSIAVRPGQHVKKGQLIGRSGNTGNSTGPHLHYEERRSPYGYWNHRKPEFNRES